MSGTGAFSENLTNLNSDTTYYYRAYATNIAGTSTGSIQRFDTPSITQGGAPLSPPPVLCNERADLNNDCKINLTDFSIAGYRWLKRPMDNPFIPIEAVKLNADGTINLTDFSIMAYYWTN